MIYSRFKYTFALIISAIQWGNPLSCAELALSPREQLLIAHVQQSIERADQGLSKLPPQALEVQGMSSPKVRHLLNNLCSLPRAGYLEIGCWMGSTWIASLCENYPTMSLAVAIDNWSQFGGSTQEFSSNCNRFLKNYDYQFYELDCFQVNLESIFHSPVTIYFYDGDHEESSQKQAFTYYNRVFDDVFIAIVDDWNLDRAQNGTRTAFRELNYQVLYERVLPSRFNCDVENWWNGLYVAVIRKPSATQ